MKQLNISILLTVLMSMVGVKVFSSATYVTNVTSTLTGQTGIVAFSCPEVGTLYDVWVTSGKPYIMKVAGKVNADDLKKLSREKEIRYIDLSEAHICASESFQENYIKGDWLGYSYDTYEPACFPQVLVIPDDLEELNGNGYYDGHIGTIYSRSSTPCKLTNIYTCYIFVPYGSRQTWKTMNPNVPIVFDGPLKTVKVETAGTLQDHLSSDDINMANQLIIEDGSVIDARDFKVIKSMKNLVSLRVYARIDPYDGYYGPNPTQLSYKKQEIPAYIFQNNLNLEEVSFGGVYYDSGYIIGDYAFDGCSNLAFLTLSQRYRNVVTSLGDFCFRNTSIKNTFCLVRSETGLLGGTNHVGKNPFFGTEASLQNGLYDSSNETDIHYEYTN